MLAKICSGLGLIGYLYEISDANMTITADSAVKCVEGIFILSGTLFTIGMVSMLIPYYIVHGVLYAVPKLGNVLTHGSVSIVGLMGVGTVLIVCLKQL
jgi:hypothetical protein